MQGYGALTRSDSADLDQLIYVNEKARPLVNMLKQISDKIGARIVADPGIGERIMGIQFENVPAKDLLKRTCSVCCLLQILGPMRD